MNDSDTMLESRRKEERLHAVLAISVFFQETAGQPTIACTYEISSKGTRITRIPGINAVDQYLWIQRLKNRAKYRVVWIGEPGTEQANQVGLNLVDPSAFIWDDSLRNRLI